MSRDERGTNNQLRIIAESLQPERPQPINEEVLLRRWYDYERMQTKTRHPASSGMRRFGSVEQPSRADDAEREDEPEGCRQHQQQRVCLAQRVPVLGDRDLPDNEAVYLGLSDRIVRPFEACEGRQRLTCCLPCYMSA